jgi:hypothetical protein
MLGMGIFMGWAVEGKQLPVPVGSREFELTIGSDFPPISTVPTANCLLPTALSP